MNEPISFVPDRPLIWSDFVLDLQDLVFDYPMPIYIVGGGVRDAYLHRPIKDLDLATPVDSIKLARMITDHFDGDIFVMDKERGVARVFVALPDDTTMTIDVARFRGDGLQSDLHDRDFTINAMAVDLHGELSQVIDPYGGIEDGKQKLIRACHENSLQDDPVRILRAIRQSVQLGFRIESDTLRAIRTETDNLVNISPERIRDEVFNMLSLNKPALAFRIAERVGVLDVIFPDLAKLPGLPQSPPHVYDVWQHTLITMERLHEILVAIHPLRNDNIAATFDLGMLNIQLTPYRARLLEYMDGKWANGRPHRALLLLVALLHNLGKARTEPPNFAGYIEAGKSPLNQYAEDLRLSSAEQHFLSVVTQNYPVIQQQRFSSALDIHRFWYEYGSAGIDIILLGLADFLGIVGSEIVQDEWLVMVDRTQRLLTAYYDHYDTIVKPTPLLDGNQLVEEFNLEPGPVIGELLTLLREAQVTKDISTVEEAQQFVAEYLAGR